VTNAATVGAELIVDLAAITDNWRFFADQAAGAAAAVVKADAYGTGMAEVAHTLEAAGCSTFFVATPAEGAELRSTSADSVIFVLGGLTAGSERIHHQNGLTPVLNDLDQIERWASTCQRFGTRPAAIHVDTGINRLGIPFRQLDALAGSLARNHMDIDLLVSHLACADDPADPLNRIQLDRFHRVLEAFPGVSASFCGSAGVLLGRDYHFDMIRPGIGIYGGNAMPGRATAVKPVVTVRAPVLQVHRVVTGDTVGYGARYRPERDRLLATVAVGYADGFPRSLTNRGVAAVNRIDVPYVGAVSMDSIVLDITDAEDVEGPVEMLGPRVTVNRLAELAGTIPNEILTGLGGRLERTHANA
jgi:alanine racemase